MQIDGPLASDVVGDFDVTNTTTLEILGDNVVRVDIAITSLV